MMKNIVWLALLVLLIGFSACGNSATQGTAQPDGANAGVTWPPVRGEKYPDVTLIDKNGSEVQLSELSSPGRVMLIEPIGMTCEACQAFVGGHLFGGFGNVTPQKELKSMEEYFPEYTGGLSLDDDRITYIQLILYNEKMGAPTAEDITNWGEHFDVDAHPNRMVLGGTPDLLGKGSYNMIPGFQLVDDDFVLRADAAGHSPPDSLWETLLPMVPDILNGDA